MCVFFFKKNKNYYESAEIRFTFTHKPQSNCSDTQYRSSACLSSVATQRVSVSRILLPADQYRGIESRLEKAYVSFKFEAVQNLLAHPTYLRFGLFCNFFDDFGVLPVFT